MILKIRNNGVEDKNNLVLKKRINDVIELKYGC